MSLHQEFENAEGEEYQADLSALASPSSQNGPEIYILPLTEVSLPVSKQPGRSSKKAHKTDAASLTHTCFELQRTVLIFFFSTVVSSYPLLQLISVFSIFARMLEQVTHIT